MMVMMKDDDDDDARTLCPFTTSKAARLAKGEPAEVLQA